MSTVHNLPSGGSIEVLDVDDLRAKHKRAVQRSIALQGDNTLKTFVDATDHLIEVVTLSVSLPYAPEARANLEGWVELLKLDDLNVIDGLMTPLSKAMFPPSSETGADVEDNADSPSVPVSE